MLLSNALVFSQGITPTQASFIDVAVTFFSLFSHPCLLGAIPSTLSEELDIAKRVLLLVLADNEIFPATVMDSLTLGYRGGIAEYDNAGD